jgi:hypothetical protein
MYPLTQATFSINPPTFEETTSIIITINGSSVKELGIGECFVHVGLVV